MHRILDFFLKPRGMFHMLLLRIGAAVGLLTMLTPSPADAQSETIIRPEPSQAPYWDERVMRILGEGKTGAIALDVEVGPGRKCDQINITTGRLVDGQWRTMTIHGSRWVFGMRTSYGAMSTLVPGDFVIASVACKLGNHTTSLNGPHAKFRVNIGEVINLGVLKLDYQTEGFFVVTGTMKKSIGGMTPETRAKMKEQFPRAFAKAVERRMTLVGAAEVNIKKR